MHKNRPLDAAHGEEINWLVFDLNSFFASCEQQADPNLRGKYVGVVPMLGVETTCLLAASKEAKLHYGLKTGTQVGEALDRCPELILLQADHKKYVHYHHKVLAAIEECTPIEKVLSIDEVACRLTGSQRIPENALKLAAKIKENVRAKVGHCLTSSIGIAPNILLAKLGSDMHKPDGLVLLRPCDLPQKILHLKPRDFSGIGPQMEKRLQHAGIFSMQDLYACDRPRLRRVWGGVEGERFYMKIWGHDLNREESQKRVLSHQHVLEPHLRNIQGGYHVLHHLLLKGAERLRHINYYCTRLTVSVKLDHHRGHWHRETDFAETQDSQMLLRLLHEIWREYEGHRPLRVGIALHGLVEAQAHQQDLFERPKPKQLFAAIDGINSKFGRHTVSFGLNPYIKAKLTTDKIAFQRVPELEYL